MSPEYPAHIEELHGERIGLVPGRSQKVSDKGFCKVCAERRQLHLPGTEADLW